MLATGLGFLLVAVDEFVDFAIVHVSGVIKSEPLSAT